MESLESQLDREFERLHISDDNREFVMNWLKLLLAKDEYTYGHSMRAGLLSSDIGEFHKIAEPKPLFYSGCLHDIGKIGVDSEVLKKTEGFNEKDMEHMKEHVILTYRLLKDKFPYTANICVRSHQFQKDGYPKELPDLAGPFASGSKGMFNFYGLLLSIADVYDSLITRANNKLSGEVAPPKTPEEARGILFEKYSRYGYGHFINELYDEGILGKKAILIGGTGCTKQDKKDDKEPDLIVGDNPVDRLTNGLQNMLGS